MSIAILKIIGILAIVAVLAMPFLPFNRFFSFYGSSYKTKYRRNNLVFVVLTSVELFIICFLLPPIINLVDAVKGLGFIEWIASKIPDRIEYAVSTIVLLLFNVLLCLLLLGVKRLVRAFLDKKVFVEAAIYERSAHKNTKKATKKKNASKKGATDKKIKLLRKNSTLVFGSAKKKKTTVHFDTDVDDDADDLDTEDDEKDAIDEESLTTLQRMWYKVIGLFYLKEKGYKYVKDGTYKWAKELKIFTYIICGAYILSCVFMLIPIFFSFSNLSAFYKIASFIVKNTFIYPVLSLAILHELLFFVDGDMKATEVEKTPVMSLAFGKKQNGEVDLLELKNEFIENYGKRYNIENFSATHSSGKKKFNSKQRTTVIKNIHKFIQKKNGFVNDGYLQGVENMLKGKHVLFDSSVYSSLGEYIIHYLFVYLSFGNRVLFICKDKQQSIELKEYLEASTKEVINTTACFWNVGNFKTLHNGIIPDILILTPSEFLRFNLKTDGKEFFDELVDVFVCDVDKILASNNYYCLIMAKKLEKLTTYSPDDGVDADLSVNTNRRISYRFFTSGHVQGIAGSIIQFFNFGKDELAELHSFDMNSETEVFVWRTGMDPTVFVDRGANQKPLEMVITEIADKKGVPNKNLITDSSLYSSHVGGMNSLTVNKRYIGSSPFGFVVVSDDKYNLPVAIYDYTRFSGRKKSVVHIVSKPYLLRDYFAFKAKEYVHEVELIGKTTVEHADAYKVKIISLLCDAVNGIERETFIKRASQLLGSGEELTLDECVKRCYKVSVGDAGETPKYHFSMGYNSEHVKKVFVTLTEPEKLYDNLLQSTKNVTVTYDNTMPDDTVPVFANQITQHYIRGQVVVMNNVPYTISSVDKENGILKLDNGVFSVNVPGDYIQSRVYSFGDVEKGKTFPLNYRSEETVVSQITITPYTVNVTVDTLGYYSIESSVQTVNLKEANLAKYVPILGSDREEIRRNINTNALIVEMTFAGKSDARLSYSLAVILQEFMKTMFPEEYRCISVCPILEKEEEEKLYEASPAICDLYPRITSFDSFEPVIECGEGEGVIRFAFIEDVDGGNGAVATLFGGNGVMLLNMLHVVADYLEWSIKHEGKFKYLYFGYDDCPAVFDFNGLYEIVSSLKYNIDRKTGEYDGDEDKCYFCHQQIEAGKGTTLSDGRRICDECIATTTDTYEKLEDIFSRVLKAIKDSTSVADTFPDKISVDFVSTEDLRKRFSVGENEEHPIAYCNHTTKCIYVEYGLSAAALCGVLSKFITELWQDKNIVNDGSAIYSGHGPFVEIQTLEALNLKEVAMAFKAFYKGHEGLAELVDALNDADTDDSFAFFAKGTGGRRKRGEDPDPDPTDEDIVFAVERDPDSLVRYNRDKLSEDDRAVYNQISETVYGFLPETGPLCRTITVKRCRELLDAFENDNPEVFWCNSIIGIIYEENGNASNVVIKYCMTAEEKEKRKKEIEKVIAPFVGGVTTTMSDYEAALKIFENIVELADYDYDTLEKEKAGLIPDSAPDDMRSIYGVFVDKKAVCAGYAKAYQFILNRLGIECTYVIGPCKGEGWHAWNLIKLEGSHYYVDVTWGEDTSGVADHDYFCITTEELLRTRDIHREENYPVCEAVKCNYHVRSKLYFKAYDADKFAEVLTKAVKNGEKAVSIKLANKALYDLVVDKLGRNRGAADIIEAAGGSTGGCYYPNSVLYTIRFKIV